MDQLYPLKKTFRNYKIISLFFFPSIEEKVSLTAFLTALTSVQLFVWKNKQNSLLWPPATSSILFFETQKDTDCLTIYRYGLICYKTSTFSNSKNSLINLMLSLKYQALTKM